MRRVTLVWELFRLGPRIWLFVVRVVPFTAARSVEGPGVDSFREPAVDSSYADVGWGEHAFGAVAFDGVDRAVDTRSELRD